MLPVGSFRSLVPHLLQSPTSCNAQQEKSFIPFRCTTIHSVLHLLFPTHIQTQVKRCSPFGRQQIKSPSHYSTFFGILQFLKVKKRAVMPYGCSPVLSQSNGSLSLLLRSSVSCHGSSLGFFATSFRSSSQSQKIQPLPIILLACGSLRAAA